MTTPKTLDTTLQKSINDIELSQHEKNSLAHARAMALDNPKRSFFSALATPKLAYASVLLTVGIISFSVLKTAPDLNQNSLAFNGEFALIANQDALEMYQDLEFYMWLEVAENPINKG